MLVLALALFSADAREYYVPPQPIPLEPTEAHRFDAATDPRPAATLDWLEGAECVGDGRTTLHMYFFAIAPDGASITDLNVQITASAGRIGRLDEHGGGLYSVPFTPPEVGVWTEVSFHAVGLTPDRQRVDSHFTQWVMPEQRPTAAVATAKRERPDREARRRARAESREAPDLPERAPLSARAGER